jgi:hypothetical protein
VGTPEGKGPLGRPRHIWEGNIKIYFERERDVGAVRDELILLRKATRRWL